MKQISTPYNSYNTNIIVYSAAFSQKRNYLGSDGNGYKYKNERAQQGIWLEVGKILDDDNISGEAQSLYRAGKCLDAYEAEARTHGSSPNVTVGEQAGTILLGDNPSNYQYKIGPFKMSDYAYLYSADAENYSGYSVDANGNVYHDGLMGGITKGQVILNNGIEFSIDGSSCKIEYSKDGNNNRKGTYWSAPSNYNFPWPNSTFYIVINKELCADATTLSNIKFTYQSTRAEGDGWVIESKYVNTQWTMANIKKDSLEDGGWESFNWASSLTVQYGQPVLVVKKANVYVEEKDFISEVNLRLTTNVSVDKYIVKVEHVAEDGVIYDNETERINKTKDWKNQNSVKIERGDKVTFKIILRNNQNEEVKFKVRDILPSNYTYSITPEISNWVKIPGNGTQEITVTVNAACETGTDNNTALLITRNKGNTGTNSDSVDYPRTTSRSGPVVNIAELEGGKLEDSDYFTIKEYNISIDKYITQVNHIGRDEITYGPSDSRKQQNNSTKEENPVYAEYGDKISYQIDIYNTAIPFEENRNASPYWDPAKAYVNITDTLPNRYSDLTITVSNGSGNISVPATSSNSGGNFTVNNVMVPENGKTTITVTLVVEEHDCTKLEKNTAELTGEIKNINKRKVVNHSTQALSSDLYHINDYNLSIHKYIDKYEHKVTDFNNSNNFTSETVKFTDRSMMSEKEKSNRPLAVEKTEIIEYAIRLNNNAKLDNGTYKNGLKNATSIRPTDVTDVFDNGLKYKSSYAKAYKVDGSDKYGDLPISVTVLPNNTYKFTLPNKTESGNIIILEPGEYMIYYITAEVVETNMYLYKLSNMAILTTLTNINNTDNLSRVVKNDEYNENEAAIQVSRDYIKLKDLVIAGKVWLDTDKDGYMGKNASGVLNSYIDYEANPSSKFPVDSGDSELAMKGIKVKLYSVIGDTVTLERTTKTDENGLFTFGKGEDGSLYDGVYSYDEIEVRESHQRISKATNKDKYLNYTTSSEFIEYYIEYEYDGLVFKSTEVYSGKNNLEDDGTLIEGDKYKIDSNAKEFKKDRDEFNLKHEVVGYNKAYNSNLSNSVNLEYEKVAHNSYLKVDQGRVMTARSFVIDTEENTQTTKYLWLFKPTEKFEKPETDYLKYINLGLEQRDNLDLSVVQDVYELKNTVNGEEMTYFYNQNKYALDGSNVDHSGNGASEDYESQFYMTRKKEEADNDNVGLEHYTFKYYDEDYRYKVDKYNIETVRNYKTKDSELNSEITFRIIVKNNKNGNKLNKSIPVYAGINEVIEYFDTDFMDIQYNEDGTVKTINVKTKDENGYLVDTKLKIAEAYFVLPDGSKLPATINNEEHRKIKDEKVLAKDSIYNDNRVIDGYNTVYIRPNIDGINKVMLAEGENVDILIKFIVDKPNRDSEVASDREVKLGLKTAIAEIGAYSTYYKNTDGSYYPAGLVDIDSNPGNFGETYSGISFDKSRNNGEDDPYLKLYEDDTYKSGIFTLTGHVTNRFIEGQVWDDARSQEAKTTEGKDTSDGIQYIGDGKNGDVINSNNANSKAQKNKALKNADGTFKEEKDFAINDIGVKLVEFVRIPVYDTSGKLIEERTYEETIKVSNNSIVEMRTGDRAITGITEDGKYILKGFLPGEYVVRFIYGDYENLSTDYVAIFNGQDYKSTTYQAGLSECAEALYKVKDKDIGTVIRDLDTIVKVRRILENKGLSDAKDDEIRRLETISYSETLNNNKTQILRGMNSTNKELQGNKTSMYADTVDFTVTTETLNLAELDIENVNTTQIKYSNLKKLGDEKRQDIKNIDFGLQYRPEQQVALNKYVKNLTITTSDMEPGKTEPLVNAKFNEYYGIVVDTDFETGVTTYLGYKTDGDVYETIHIPEDYSVKASLETNEQYSNRIKEYIDTFMSNNGLVTSDLNAKLDNCKKNQDGTYQVLIAGTELDTENSIGLSNLQYLKNDRDSHDKDSNQGFVYLNIDDEIMQGAEIKIQYLFAGSNLSEIDRVNKNLSALRLRDNTEVSQYESGFTEKELYSGALTARNDLFREYYRYENNSLDNQTASKKKLDSDIIYRVKSKTIGDSKHDYYGRYLGSAYYTGKVSNKDVIAELKIDKILDYIDNNLVFKQDENNADSVEHFWMTTTTSELLVGGYISPSILKLENGESQEVTQLRENGLLVDSDGIAYNTPERSNLALLQDLRTSDSQGENDIVNADITKFLSPRDSKDENSYGKASIVTSKIISSEDETENMTYENVGEIVEYSSVTGRVTSLSTTLGNVDLSKPSKNPPNSSEFEQNQEKESDTASVEKVTLTPPTGMRRTDRIIRGAVKGASYLGILIITIVVAVFAFLTGIKIYRNRKIK